MAVQMYVEAFDKEGNQILGNGDGQRSWRGGNFRRTAWFRTLRDCTGPWKRPYKWHIVDDTGDIKEVLFNRKYVQPSKIHGE